MPPRSDALARFHEKYEVEASGCWVWTASRYRNGYAYLWDGERNVIAHRFSYERLVGRIPDGMEIDHLCNVRACVNPQHFELVDHAENRRRSRERKTHCSRGHEFTEESTYWFRGNRYCRTCRAANEQVGYHRRKAATRDQSPA